MRLPLLLLLALVASPARAEEAPPATPPSGEPAPDPAALWREIDALYLSSRDGAGVMDQLDAKIAAAEKAAGPGGAYDATWRRARQLFWRSELVPTDAEKATLAKRGWAEGEAAVKIRPSGGEGHYYAGISAGNYGDAIGVPKALLQGVEAPFVAAVKAAERLLPGIDQGGPAMTLGRYHFKLPWPKQDAEASVKLLRGVIAAHPKNLRARFYLADTLLGEDEPKEAKRLLDEVLALTPGKDPPEERLVKRWAKALLPKVEAELKD